MGGGFYCTEDRQERATKASFLTNSIHENFKERSLNLAMNPYGISVRESRDSIEHPNSLSIILGLDVTGSMGSIPQFMVKNGLPHFMEDIISNGIDDPQVLFVGIGDHECDNAPLQVGQFESSDKLLDAWLTKLFLEGGGGGNDGESYLLAWYFALRHVEMDCLKKRNQKGFLFTIGDEKTLKSISRNNLQSIMGKGEYKDMTSLELLDKAKEKFHIYHLHIKEGYNGNNQSIIDDWRQILRDNLIIVENKNDVSNIMAKIIISHSKQQNKILPKEDIIL
jgi:hypothetical protein